MRYHTTIATDHKTYDNIKRIADEDLISMAAVVRRLVRDECVRRDRLKEKEENNDISNQY